MDSVYSKLQQELLQTYGTVRVQKYECRLRKSKKSSTARVSDSDGKVIKRRHSSIRDSDLCNVRINVSRPVDGTDDCKFHRQYLLPCRHIFHLNTEIKVLITEQWTAYLLMFAECSMETMGTVWVEEERSGRNVERANVVSRVLERVQQQLYAAYELMDRLHLEDNIHTQRMANHVQVTIGSLTSVRAEDIVHRHRPWCCR